METPSFSKTGPGSSCIPNSLDCIGNILADTRLPPQERLVEYSNAIVRESEKCVRENPIMYPDELFCHPVPVFQMSHLNGLVTLTVATETEPRYNAVWYTDHVLAQYDRKHECKSVSLDFKTGDLFHGIVISCVDPKEITRVELLVRDTQIHDSEYVIVDSIENPSFSLIRFFHHPIPVTQDHRVSWKIRFWDTTKFPPRSHPVQVNYYICHQELRTAFNKINQRPAYVKEAVKENKEREVR